MDREQVRRWESQCIEDQAPACTAACPLHVDARGLAVAVAAGDFRKGLTLLAAAAPLPRILAHVCDHPCQAQCRRHDAGDAVAIGLLERACAEFAGSAPPVQRQPAGNKKVAVVGGGLSGVSAAMRLAQRGYRIALFEAGPRLLGRMRALPPEVLPPAAIEADLAVLAQLGIVAHCDALISRHAGPLGLDALAADYDAVYLATGPEVFDETALGLDRAEDGRLRIDPLTLATSHPKIFAGGAQRYAPAPWSPVSSMADGNYTAVSIDRFLQGASLTASRDNQGPYPSRLFVNTSGIAPAATIRRTPGAHGYTREQAMQEAARCFPCHCLECVKVCPYLEEYGAYPRTYIRQIYNNESIVMGVRSANRMINSCALCGLCAEVCPEKLNMADVCLDARQGMVLRGKMPPSTFDFALRDMAFSQSDAFRLARHQPGCASSETAFLPGCQLSASSPEHVLSTYAHLSRTLSGGVGLILGCCGAPARWAGSEAKFQEATQTMLGAWESLGRPHLITACSSCFKSIREALPQIPIEPLWPHIDRAQLPAPSPGIAGRKLALHDPCSTRGIEEVEQSARGLLRALGIEVEELNGPGLTTCCGYGGLQLFANPAVAEKTAQRRAAQSDTDYVTYCAMCRDRFAHEGKRATHILDLVFAQNGSDRAARPDPGFSRRQDNRSRLKDRLLHEVWGEMEKPMETPRTVLIPEELRQQLEKRMILEQDVRRTLDEAEASGEWMQDPSTGHRLASLRVACVTYWVEYSLDGDAHVVHDAWSHRMEVR
ncbi:MAG: pyridine nucleotide-disulfide oxidoreductase/dicluster-binding protein [Acidobacteriota bacterium]